MLDGFESIVGALMDAQPSLSRKGLQLETIFSVASIVLSAVQFATVGDGSESASTFVGSTPKVLSAGCFSLLHLTMCLTVLTSFAVARIDDHARASAERHSV